MSNIDLMGIDGAVTDLLRESGELPQDTPTGHLSSHDDLYALGTDVLGAAKLPVKPTAKKVAVKMGVGKGKSPHKRAIARVGRTMDKLVKAGNLTLQRAKQYKPAEHTTALPLKKVTVKGVEILGTDKPLNAAQKAAVEKHNKAMVRHKLASTKAEKAGKKAIALAAKLAPKVGGQAATMSKLWTAKSPRTRVQGDAEILGVGEIADGLDLWSVTDIAEIMGLCVGQDGGDDTTDTGEIQMPIRGKALSKDEAQMVFKKVPEDGVIYDGSRGFARDSTGSWNAFYGEPRSGAWLYGNLAAGHPQDQDRWVFRDPPTMPSIGYYPPPAEFQTLRQIASNSMTRGWGPMIGNPGGPLAGLQYAVDDDKWFWQSDKAPVWATAEKDQALKKTLQDEKDAAKATAEAETARQELEVAQMEEAQAKQDAANALAQSAADAESQLTQQKVADAQAKLDVQQQAAEQAIALQQAKLDVEAQKAALAYAVAHPEAGPPQMQTGTSGYAPQGGGYAGPVDDYGVDWGGPRDAGMPDSRSFADDVGPGPESRFEGDEEE